MRKNEGASLSHRSLELKAVAAQQAGFSRKQGQGGHYEVSYMPTAF